MIFYNGIFLNGKESKKLIELSQEYNLLLPKIIKNMHVTFQFKPQRNLLKHLRGKETDIIIDGIGGNGVNNGVRVILLEDYKNLYKGAEIPHITISVSHEGKPINTKHLQFMNIEPFAIKGYFDYMED